MDDLNEYPVPVFEAEAALDFLGSRSLEDLEEGVRRLGVVSDLMGLVQGIAIVKIEDEGLWAEAGYSSLRAYRIAQAERLGLPPQTVSTRRMMARAWLAWRRYLGKLDLSGHVGKLVFLDAALGRYGDRRTVVAKFRSSTWREFREWALGPKLLSDGALPDVDVRLQDGALLLDGVEVLELDEGLDPEERSFLVGVLEAAYRARKGRCLAHVVPVYDQGEARAVDRFLKERRAAR